MIATSTSIISKVDAAQRLAQLHFEVEPDLKQVFLLSPVRDDDPREPIKLLEIVEGAIESGIEPVSFPPDASRGIDYPSVIVELSPRKFADLGSREIVSRGRVWQIERELRASA